ARLLPHARLRAGCHGVHERPRWDDCDGQLDDAREADCRSSRPCPGHLAALHPIARRRARAHGAFHALGQTLTTRRSQMPTRNRSRLLIITLAAAAGLVFTSTAWAHAHVSPPVALAKASTVFTLAVPTEKSGATTQVEFTPPSGF